MDSKREEFEKWYVEEMKSYAGPLSRIENGQYLYVEPLWRAYQAALASLQPAQKVRDQALTDELVKDLEFAIALAGKTYPERAEAISMRLSEYRRVAQSLPSSHVAVSIDMVLHCPACGEQHIDAPDEYATYGVPDRWTNPPHRSHLCHACGHIWRPADVPTNGVKEVKTKGKVDSPIARALQSQPAGKDAEDARRLDFLEKNQLGLFTVVDVVRRPTTMSSPAYEEVREFVGWSVHSMQDEFATAREAIDAAMQKSAAMAQKENG